MYSPMQFGITIQKLEGVPPGLTYSLKWRKKSPPLEGKSPAHTSTPLGVAAFQYTFQIHVDAKRQADGSWEEINDVAITIMHHVGEERKSIHKLGLLLNMFIDKPTSPVLVRQIGTMKLYLSITYGGASIPTTVASPKGTTTIPNDRIDVLQREIEAAERQLTSLDSDIKDKREALMNAKQMSLMKSVADNRTSSSLSLYVNAMRRKTEVQDTKDLAIALRLECSAANDDISNKEVLTEKAKKRIGDLDKQIFELEQSLSERKLQNKINETAMSDCLVMQQAASKGKHGACAIS